MFAALALAVAFALGYATSSAFRPRPIAPAGPPSFDEVEEAGEESFPAGDPPAYAGASGLGAPANAGQPAGPAPDAPGPGVCEHAVSDPASRSSGA